MHLLSVFIHVAVWEVMGNHSLLQSFSAASSGYHGEGKELGGG